MPLHRAVIAAQLDQIEADIVRQRFVLSNEDFSAWFGGETTPLLETISGDEYVYVRNRIDRMLRNAKTPQRAP